MKVGFVGLGKLGLPCALAIESKGHDVNGYDINPKIEGILKNKVLPYKEKGADELLKKTKICVDPIGYIVHWADIIFIAVQTPHDPKYEGITRLPKERVDFDYSYLKEAIKMIVKEAEEQNQYINIVIISTVLPGTIRREIMPLINGYIKLAYNPFFIAMGTCIDDFMHPEFILFGSDNDTIAYLMEDFYKSITDAPFKRMSIESAELTKVSYNTYITAKIDIANTIMELAHKIPGCNVDDVTLALQSATDRIVSPRYMCGGLGDSGGCHPRDAIALSFLARKINLSYDIYESFMIAREKQTQWLADIIYEQLFKYSLPIIILGYTFKKETNLTVGSAVVLLMNILDDMGVNYKRYDPCFEKEIPLKKKAIYFIGMNHDVFKEYEFPKGSVVIDPWRIIKDQEGIEHIKVGVNKIK